jgi:hypothetical protein
MSAERKKNPIIAQMPLYQFSFTGSVKGVISGYIRFWVGTATAS